VNNVQAVVVLYTW